MVNFKAKFKCPDCGKRWTSSNAKIAILLDVEENWQNSYQVEFRAIAYQQECRNCDVYGDMSYYENEWTRIAKIVADKVFDELGLTYPDYIGVQKSGKPSSKHKKSLCQACQHGICFPIDSTDFLEL